MQRKTNRLFILDDLRGLAIIFMVIYHILFSMIYIYKIEFVVPAMNFVSLFSPMSGLFIVICGICSRFSRSNLKRGLLLLLISLLITVVTYKFIPENTIYFGVLHMLSVSILLFALLRVVLDKIHPVIGIVLSVFLFIITLNIGERYIGIEDILKWDIPLAYFKSEFLFPIGLSSDNFVSGDYYPLLPWFFLFLCGTFIGVYLKKWNYPSFLKKPIIKPLEFLGQHSLIIYIVHQPVIIAILYVITKLFKGV